MKTNKIGSALMLIFLGELIRHLPLNSWSVQLMSVTAWISILTGCILLYKEMKRGGRKAAGLWIAATIFSIVSMPLEIASSVQQGITGILKQAGDMNEGGMEGLSGIQSYLDWFLLSGTLLYLAGCVAFMFFPAFNRMKIGWIWLTVSFAMSLLNFFPSFSIIPLFIGFYFILTRLYEEKQAMRRTSSLLFMSAGFLFSLLILLNNDIEYVIASLCGLIMWLIGVIQLRTAGYEKKGTGLFLWYGIFMIVSSVFHFLPGFIGDIAAIIFQGPAYIIITVGFFRFAAGNVFTGQTNGMHTLGGTMILCFILTGIYLLPLIGEPITALTFSVICLPFMVVGWKNTMLADVVQTIELPDNTASGHIGWKTVLGKHNGLKIAMIVIILCIGSIYGIGSKILPEQWINEAYTEAAGNGGTLAFPTLYLPETTLRKLEYAALLDNYEAQLYTRDSITTKDVKKWCQAAKTGNACAQYAVGLIFKYPVVFMSRMNDESQEYFRQWASDNRPPMQIGDISEVLGKQINMQEIWEADAHRWFEKAARQHHNRAAVEVATDYQSGSGTGQNDSKASEWLVEASEQGNLVAQDQLGLWYLNGEIIQKDPEQALYWLKKAAEKGYKVAQYHLGFFYGRGENGEENNELAIEWFRKSAAQQYPQAQRMLGYYYLYGIGVEKNQEEAVKWYQKAAEQGDQDAATSLGICYFYGTGVEKNQEKAIGIWQSASDENSKQASYFLGHCYYYGNFFKKNYKEAFKYFKKALPYEEAIWYYGHCLLYGYGVKQNASEAIEAFRAGADNDDSDCLNSLGYCYETGRGVRKNRNEAIAWYQKAAKLGNETAQKNLERVTK